MNHHTRWTIFPPLSPEANANLSLFSPVLRQLLFNRGITSEHQADIYLQASVDFDTSPFQFKDMQRVVDRIHAAIRNGEMVVIYGDYDVDGVTACVLLCQVLETLGCKVHTYIPNRFEEGYGLNTDALERLAKEGTQVIISVDCGIRSLDEARQAKKFGLDLIVTDHHDPSPILPDAFAILNPKQIEDYYPDKNLAGVGVAYKLAQALMSGAGGKYPHLLDDVLDLVALGTVADLAPLIGENRVLVRAGILQMRQTGRQGLFSLASVAGVSISSINAAHIGFMIGPRLNAAGRLDTALAAFELLRASDVTSSGRLAQQLDVQNRERQVLTKNIQIKAESIALNEDPEALILMAIHPEFNTGVVGLAAARLVEKYYRPAIVGQINEETTRCSCRSIPEFHITKALDICADLLIRHGGHAAAAGFTILNTNLGTFRERLKSIAVQELSNLDLRPLLKADMEILLQDLNLGLLKQLESLQPTGLGNPEPVFITRNLKIISSRTVGKDDKHLKLTLSDGRKTVEAIGFQLGEVKETLPERVDVLYKFESNEYRGLVSQQMNIKDIKPTGTPDS